MKILVTGIDGFVGSHLARALLEDATAKLSGFVIDKSHTPLIDEMRSGIHLEEVDIRDASRVAGLIATLKPERIYHLAGQAYVPQSVSNPLDTYHINIDGGLNILEGVRTAAPDCRVLMVSSGEIYGTVDPNRPVDELFPLKPENPYAVSKACIDMIARQYRASFGVKAVVARSFNHLGPGQSDVFVGSAFARQIAEVKLGLREKSISVGNLKAQRDFTDVRDVVRAYIALLAGQTRHDVYNVCSGRSRRIQDIFDQLVKISGVEVEPVQDPARMRDSDNPVVVGSAVRLIAETGWKPLIPIDQTLRDLLLYWEARLKK